MASKTIDDLFLHFLQDIHYAERQILQALPKMAEAAQNAQLKQALTQHRAETEGQVRRLEQVFQAIGEPAQTTTCEAIKGLIEEGEEVIGMFEAGPARDAGIAACAQAVEHYEIARYGALIAWAKVANRDDVVGLLQQTLDEEKKADALLTQVANGELNQQAAQMKKAA